MDMKIEVVFLGVKNPDEAKAFYVDKLGFNADYDHTVTEGLRFIQLTPPGSACSIAIGEGISDAKPGASRDLMMVIEDADAAHKELKDRGVDVSDVDEQQWGRFVRFSDPDGNTWALQQLVRQGG
jgi:catechol 2,3-dioxygenase-like lactoylglutathione lyase family enzyme